MLHITRRLAQRQFVSNFRLFNHLRNYSSSALNVAAQAASSKMNFSIQEGYRLTINGSDFVPTDKLFS